MRKPQLVSIATTAFNEEEILPVFYEKLCKALETIGYPFEIVVAENGSLDGSERILKELHLKDNRIGYVKLSRNFGHQGGLLAALECCQGDVIISMDADLQHPVEVLGEMLDKWTKGFDVVYTEKRVNKNQALSRRYLDRLFYFLIQSMSGVEMKGHSDYRLMDRKVLDAVLAMPETNKFLRGLVPWVGFKQCGVMYEVKPRLKGKSKFKWTHLIKLAVDGILSFSIIPLRMFTLLGFLLSAGSLAYGVYLIMLKILYQLGFSNSFLPTGWLTLATSLFFFGGVQLMGIGVLGEYVGRVYDEVKGRPKYIIQEVMLEKRGNKNEI